MTSDNEYNTRIKRSSGDVARAIGMYAVLFAWALTTIIPLLWVLLNSFKSSEEILLNGFSLPKSFNFTNYETLAAYPDVNIVRSLVNSFIISGGAMLGVMAVAGLAAFAIGRFDTKIGKWMDALMVACLLVPSFATIIPNFVTINGLPIRGTYFAAIVPLIAGNLSFSILLLSGFMRSLPKELDEAAVIDGASVLQIFARITAPLSKPMFATVGIMVFIWSYNDLITALVYLSKRSLQPVSVILTMVSNMFGTDYGAMMAVIFITIVPLLVLYVISQEQVIKGLTTGAVKG